MEFKQNKFLPAEKQIVTANPDVNVVSICETLHLFLFPLNLQEKMWWLTFGDAVKYCLIVVLYV